MVMIYFTSESNSDLDADSCGRQLGGYGGGGHFPSVISDLKNCDKIESVSVKTKQ